MSDAKPIIKVIGRTAYEIIPTEKGYAYAIFTSTVVTLLATWSHSNSLGMLYGDFFNDRGEGVGGLTLGAGIGQSVASMSGIITNLMIKKFGLREVQIFGGIIYFIGWFTNAFMDNLIQFILAYSILVCWGQGILTLGSLEVFNQYFVKKKATMYSICQIIVSLGAVVFPLFVEWSFDEYGFRGTVLILSSVFLHVIFGAILIHPLEWHSKKVPLYDAVPQHENIDKKGSKIVVEYRTHDDHAEPPTINPTSIVKEIESNPSSAREDVSILTRIYKFLEFDMFSDWIFVNIVIGIALQVPVDMTFMAMYPLYLNSIGISSADVARLLSIMQIFDILGRIFLAGVSKFTKLSSRKINYIGAIITIIARISFSYCRSWTSVLIISGIIGFVRPSLHIMLPLITSEYNSERFMAGYGLTSLVSGISALIISPAIGFVRDYTDSYLIAFHLTGGIALLCLILWTLEFWYLKYKR